MCTSFSFPHSWSPAHGANNKGSFSEHFLQVKDLHFTHRASQDLWNRLHHRLNLTDRVALCLTVHPKGLSSGGVIMPWGLVPQVYPRHSITPPLPPPSSAEEGERFLEGRTVRWGLNRLALSLKPSREEGRGEGGRKKGKRTKRIPTSLEYRWAKSSSGPCVDRRVQLYPPRARVSSPRFPTVQPTPGSCFGSYMGCGK